MNKEEYLDAFEYQHFLKRIGQDRDDLGLLPDLAPHWDALSQDETQALQIRLGIAGIVDKYDRIEARIWPIARDLISSFSPEEFGPDFNFKQLPDRVCRLIWLYTKREHFPEEGTPRFDNAVHIGLGTKFSGEDMAHYIATQIVEEMGGDWAPQKEG